MKRYSYLYIQTWEMPVEVFAESEEEAEKKLQELKDNNQINTSLLEHDIDDDYFEYVEEEEVMTEERKKWLDKVKSIRDAIAEDEASQGHDESVAALNALTDDDLLKILDSFDTSSKDFEDDVYSELFSVATNADDDDEDDEDEEEA